MEYVAMAQTFSDTLVEDRRYLHSHAELGMELPETIAYVKKKLRDMGYEPKDVGGGVVALAGNGGKTFMLRADMDALPMKEDSGEPFASANENAAHTCGHDLHTAMLLGAARLLKENETQLKGTVKLMFQPGEEIGKGAKSMIDAGLLENPKVDAAFGIHVAPGPAPGVYMFNAAGDLMNSVDSFEITVTGKGGHGASPNMSIDPISIAAHIVIGLQEIIAREVNPEDICVMTICSIHAGSNHNIIPNTATLQGNIRAKTREMRALMVQRMQEIAKQTAAMYRGSAEIEMVVQLPALHCDKDLTKSLLSYIDELTFSGKTPYPGMRAPASEDFAEVSELVPSFYMFLSAGFGKNEPFIPPHHPKARFNEDALSTGAAIMAHCATRWLEEHAQ